MRKFGVVRKIGREPHEIEGFYRVRMDLMQIRGVNEGAPVKVRAAFGSDVNRFQFETPWHKCEASKSGNFGVENPKFTYEASRGGGWDNRDGVFFDDGAGEGAVEFDYEEREMSRIRESNLRITLLDSSRKHGVVLGEIFVNLLTLLANRCLTYDLTLMHGEAGHKFRGSNSKDQRNDLIHAVQRSQINGEKRNFHVVIHIEMSPYIETGIKMFDVRLDSKQKHVGEFGTCPWVKYSMSSVRLRWHHATFQDIAKGRVKFEEDASAKFKLKMNPQDRSGNYAECLPSSSDRVVRCRECSRIKLIDYNLNHKTQVRLKDSLLGMRTSFLIFELQSKSFFAAHWSTFATGMVPLRQIYDKTAKDDAVWYFDASENKGYVQMRDAKSTKKLNAFVRFQYKILKAPDAFVVDVKSIRNNAVLYVANDSKDGIVSVNRESILASPRPSRRRLNSLADVYVKNKGIHLSKSQNSVLDAIDAAYDMYSKAQMSQEDLNTHIKTLSDDAGLPGLRTVISKYYKNSHTKKSDDASELYMSTKSLRRSIHEKDLKKSQQILRQISKMSTPTVKQLKLTGAGRLLDTISKRIKDKDMRDQALQIITSWKIDLKLRQSQKGKKILNRALSSSI